MAWDVDENFDDESIEDSENEETRMFVAIADNDDETPWSARLAPGIPSRNDPHNVNIGVFAKKIRARRRGQSHRVFEVEVTYGEITAEQPADPLDWSVTLRYEKIVETRPYNRAFYVGTAYEILKPDGTTLLANSSSGAAAFVPDPTNANLVISAVCNSAGDPFEDSPEAEYIRCAMIATRNEESVDFQLINDWQNAINTHAFYGAQPGQLRLTIEPGDAASKNGIIYRPIEYRFDFRADGWDDYILDAGYSALYQVDATHIEPRKIKDKSQAEVSSPQLLDGAGNVLARLIEPVSAPSVQAVFHCFRPYTNRRNFAGLGLVLP